MLFEGAAQLVGDLPDEGDLVGETRRDAHASTTEPVAGTSGPEPDTDLLTILISRRGIPGPY